MNNFLKNLYNEKLKNACYFETLNNKFCLVYLGSYDFIIIHNYFGCVATGCRKYDHEKNKVNIEYILHENSIQKSDISRILKKHENKIFINNKDVLINIIDY